MKIEIVHGRKYSLTGDSSVEFRLYYENKQTYISSGIRVKKSEWRLGKITNRPDAEALNERLAILYEKINTEINRLLKAGLPIEADHLRHIMWAGHVPASREMYHWLAAQIEMLKLQPGSRQHYHTLLLRLREFKLLMHWHDLTVENIYQFDAFIRQLKNKKGQPISDGGVFTYHKCLKALLYRAVRFGVIDRNPYDRLRGQFPRGEKATIEYLTEAEMKAVEAITPTPGTPLGNARDLFVFQMYTGMSYSDTQAFDLANYQYVDGHWQTMDTRIKTGVPYVSRLLPPAVAVLQRNGMRLPTMLNQKYNQQLKNLADAAGVRKHLTSHMARHTFATWALHNGVPIEIVSRMLGHTDIAMTQRYAKVLAEDVTAQFTALESVINTDNGNH